LNGSEDADLLYGDARGMTGTDTDHPVNTSTGGNDILNGNGGNDTLYGDAELMTAANIGGNDILNGGTGDDDLWGNSGLDTFVFDLGSDQDTIHDFVIGEDAIELTDYGFESTDDFGIADNGVGGSLITLSPTDTINVLNVSYTDIQDNATDVFVI
jgi:Ca2+-binding RTX toxin-like protein